MTKEWSELNKTMQNQLKKENSFRARLETLFDLRNQLMNVLTSFSVQPPLDYAHRGLY